MSQQGTPFGAITLLNQARMSAGTSLNWPLSKASAAQDDADMQASNATCANLRMRSSMRVGWLFETIGAIKPEPPRRCTLKV
jgi:hypothetical protein